MQGSVVSEKTAVLFVDYSVGPVAAAAFAVAALRCKKALKKA